MSQDDSGIGDRGPGLSRRVLLRGAAGLGAAGVTAGVLVNVIADTGSAAPASAAAEYDGSADDPLIVHVRDTSTGDVELFVGTRMVRFRDPALVARIARAAR